MKNTLNSVLSHIDSTIIKYQHHIEALEEQQQELSVANLDSVQIDWADLSAQITAAYDKLTPLLSMRDIVYD